MYVFINAFKTQFFLHGNMHTSILWACIRALYSFQAKQWPEAGLIRFPTVAAFYVLMPFNPIKVNGNHLTD